MPWSDALIRLQEIDIELQEINQRLSEINNGLHDQTDLVAAQHAAQEAAEKAKIADKAQRDLEYELERVQLDLQYTENSLYGGSITNARELRDLQAKSQSLRRRKTKLEDDLLEAMVARDDTNATANRAETELANVTEHKEEQRQNLLEEQENIRQRGETLLKEAQRLKQIIPPTVMESYQYLKSRTGGMPVARLVGDICSMCGMEVLAPTQRKVKNGEEAFCDGCRRLIVP